MLNAARGVFRETLDDDVGTLAASLAYRALLSIFPFFIFLGALGGAIATRLDVQDPTGEIMTQLGTALPSDARSVLETQLRGVLEANQPGLLSFGLLAALWAASSAVSAVMKAMNRAYDVEEGRPFWKRTLVSLAFVLFGGLFILAAFVLLVAGGIVITEVVERIGGGVALEWALRIGRFVLAGFVLLFAVAFLYWSAPNAQLKYRLVTPGAVLFVVAWSAMTLLFGFYVSNFGSYNATYGSLGGVVILLVWLYLSAYVLLVGAETNAVAHRRTQGPVTAKEGNAGVEGVEGVERGAAARGATVEASRRRNAARMGGYAARSRARGLALVTHARDRDRPTEESPSTSRGAMLMGALVALIALRRVAAR